MVNRRCISCFKLEDRDKLLKVTVDNSSKNVVINPDSLTFGRSAYLCYNKDCIEMAFKKDRLKKRLKVSTIQDELKGQLLDELRNN